ncbi:hypothetical protein Q8A73_000328 [Channa argus]|nr:hypothetical protein Q8A73_000328 [Channa argus]
MSLPQLCADKQQLSAAEQQKETADKNTSNGLFKETNFRSVHPPVPAKYFNDLNPPAGALPPPKSRVKNPDSFSFPAQTQTNPSCSAAASILVSCPVGASRVLDCLSHMTRVFVPVISASISVNQCR